MKIAGLLFASLIASAQTKSLRLEDLTWKQAAEVLTPRIVVMIPIGAASKEHGPHLKLSNDRLLAEYFTEAAMKRTAVVVAPLVNYHFYPAFVEYPGATSLRLETARDLIVDICRGLAKFGPRKFYALNTGVSTVRPLQASAEILEQEGIDFRFTNLLESMAEVEKRVLKQSAGTHADEGETSMMLYIAPKSVHMEKASKDFPSRGPGPLQWQDAQAPRYSPSGIYGDATLATRAKGEALVKAVIDAVVRDIDAMRP